jgi:prepilin-type N-terminal cleavage/methylation domain-containing protein
MKHPRSRRAGGFSLVELLVVITIIGILASLAVPGINGALQKARQTEQINNVRNIGTVMFTYSTDHDGNYSDPADTSALTIFQSLMDDNYIKDGGIFFASSSGKSKWAGGALAGSNVSYGCAVQATTSDDDLLPLVFGINSGLPGATPNQVDSASAGQATLASGSGPWGNQGVIVFYKGNQAKFLKADSNGVVNFIPVGYDGRAATLSQP